MKTIKKSYLIKALIPVLSSINIYNINCAIGCIDNSYHMEKKGDPKTFHYVKCNCDCQKYAASAVRGICPKCGHYHDPGEFNVASYEELKNKKTASSKEQCICKEKENVKSVCAVNLKNIDFKRNFKKEINFAAKAKVLKKAAN